MTAKQGTASRLLWWVLGLVALVRLVTLGSYPLTDTTEARYGEVARKMAELGNWVTPLYDYGVPFWAKPPLTTWLSAASMSLFGVNEFAARLPYWLLAVLIAWLVWQWVRRIAGDAGQQAQWTVALLSGTLLYLIASAAVMTDLGLVLGTTLAMRGFWAVFEGDSPASSSPFKPLPAGSGVWLLFVGLGIGLLAKGPIAVVLSALPIGLWMLLTGNIKTSWQRVPWVKGSLLTLAIAAPWYVMAEIRTPGFWEYFFIGEHWKRFTVTGWAGDKYGTAHATQRGAIWLFALAASMPWPVLLALLWVGRKRVVVDLVPQEGRSSFTFYLLAWALAPCLFFTLSGNILWTYVLPGLPAMALLAARWLAGDVRARWISGVLAAGVVLMSLLVATFFVREELADSWKSAKTVVLANRAASGGLPLYFVGDLPYSASFYSQGKAKAVADYLALQAVLQQGAAQVALNPEQIRALPPELKSRLVQQVSSGAYSLFAPAPAR